MRTGTALGYTSRPGAALLRWPALTGVPSVTATSAAMSGMCKVVLRPPPPVLAVGVPTVLPLPICGSGDSSGICTCGQQGITLITYAGLASIVVAPVKSTARAELATQAAGAHSMTHSARAHITRGWTRKRIDALRDSFTSSSNPC